MSRAHSQEGAMKRRPIAWALLGAVLALMVASSVPAADPGSEALRRRVQRFYVLSYLNRHGEMWELFTDELRRRMGDDKREYIASARQAGFELFASRIDSVELREGGAAVVDVSIQVQMPGSVEVTWRRHRMAWRSGEDGWRYAGSLDITHEERDVAADSAELKPVQQASPPQEPVDDLLPPRRRVSGREDRPRAVEPRKGAVPSLEPAPAPPGDPLEGDRWDLVALPPEGKLPPAEIERASAVTPSPAPGAGSPSGAPSGSVEPQAPKPASAPTSSERSERPQWLPPDRAAVASEPGMQPERVEPRRDEKRTARSEIPRDESTREAIVASAADAGDESIDELVRRAMDAGGLKRLRALEKIRHSTHERLPALAVQALPHAPISSQVVLIERLAALGTRADAGAVLPWIDSDVVDLRAAALGALGELGSVEHAPLVHAALERETAPAARVAALRSLGQLGGGGSPGADAIARALADTRLSDDERAAAAEAVAVARLAEAEPALLRVLGQGRPHRTFLASMAAAGRLASPALVRGLESLAAEGGVVESLHGSQPLRLLALRALCTAEVEGAGLRLAREMLAVGTAASAFDVDRAAETGETRALVELLAHPAVLVRVRAADLLGRSVADDSVAAMALPAIERAEREDHDPRVLQALARARERLSAR